MNTAFALCFVLLAATPSHVTFFYGQSNTYGALATNPVSDTRYGDNSILTGNVSTQDVSGGTGILVPSSGAWPLLSLVETELEMPRSAASNVYQDETGNSAIAVTFARGGSTYALTRNGTVTWDSCYSAFNSLRDHGVVSDHGTLMQSPGLVVFLGESDDGVGTTAAQYEGLMGSLWVQWNNCIRSYTPSTTTWSPIFLAQHSSWMGWGHTTPRTAYGQYLAAKAYLGKVILIGPQHQFAHADQYHRTTAGACLSAAKAGEAIAFGPTWKPLWPESVSLSGSTITMTMHVPYCPMQFNPGGIYTNIPANHGLEYTCSSSPPSISNVTNTSCTGNTGTLTVALGGTPDATCITNDVIRGAWTGTGGVYAGPTVPGSAKSDICDSDGFVWDCGSGSVNIPNCLVTFEHAVSGV